MYFYGLPVLILQIFCAVHVIRTGRNYWWLALIFFFPLVGGLVYLIAEVVPDIRVHGWRMGRRIAKAIDPQRDLRRQADQVAVAGTVQNRLKLAEEHLAAGSADEAIELFKGCLTGMYADDPNILLNLARAYFRKERYADVRETLDHLSKTSPDFKSAEGHLMYGVALEKLGATDRALEEYAALAKYYPGLEAKGRYAVLLKQQEQTDRARELFEEIVFNARNYRKFYKKEELKWVDVAKANLG
jgi:hypothetical protein